MAFKQDNRLLRIKGASFTDSNTHVLNLSGHESISRPYEFSVQLCCTELKLKAADLIGKSLTVEVESDDPSIPTRLIHGGVSQFTAGELSGESAGKTRYRIYHLRLVPWLWFLSQTSRCFIYFPEREDKNVAEIIEAVLKRAKDEFGLDLVFDAAGIAPLKSRIVKHCVQYRETDLNFLSRIFEQYGVYYYFEHSDGSHKLILDMKAGYPVCKQAKVKLPRGTAAARASTDHLYSWQHDFAFVPGKSTLADYNFETPTTRLLPDSAKITAKHAQADKFEIYDYPGEHDNPGDADTDARVRQEEEETSHDQVSGSGTCRSFAAGYTFELEGREDQALDGEAGEYLILQVQHRASQPGPESGGSVESEYSNSFQCLPKAVQYRPARQTPKPTVSGIHTAVVVGPSGKEIHTDKYGRIKVAFHWDRENKDRPGSSRTILAEGEKFFCWVRVAQNIAGNRWGFMAIPRIGQEVVVDFIEGDPDRPLVIGGVYNAGQMPHYNPEEHATRTYIKTNSSPGGDGHNELRFEDKKDKEQIYVHAEKDMDVRVKNNSKEIIYGNRDQIIGWEGKDGEKGGDQREEIKQDRHQIVHRDHTEKVGGDMRLLVGGGDGDGNQHVLIKKDQYLLTEGDRHTHIKGDTLEAIDGGRNTNIGGDQVVDVQGSSAHIAGADHLLQGVNISVEGTAICLKSGGNSITVDPSGVTIVGTLVRINSGPAPPVISQAAMLQSRGPTDAEEAEPAEAQKADNTETGDKSAPN
ncbi:MAG: type VI secretion system tip protein TssI/VgrG [Planctomycetota bacterium]